MSQINRRKKAKIFSTETFNVEPVTARQAPYRAAMDLLFYIDASFWDNREVKGC